MNTKLTLSIDKGVIRAAKNRLQTKNKSLSRLIEDYFKVLLSLEASSNAQTPIVKELTGIVTETQQSDRNETITEYLLEKYK